MNKRLIAGLFISVLLISLVSAGFWDWLTGKSIIEDDSCLDTVSDPVLVSHFENSLMDEGDCSLGNALLSGVSRGVKKSGTSSPVGNGYGFFLGSADADVVYSNNRIGFSDVGSISLWVNPTYGSDEGDTAFFLAKRNDAYAEHSYQFGYDYHRAGSYLSFAFYKDGKWYDWVTTDYQVPVEGDVWTHLTVVYDKEYGARIYANGDLKATQVLTGDIYGDYASKPSIPVTGEDLIIGARKTNTGYTNYYQGSMDELTIWNRVLVTAEIQKLANGGRASCEDCPEEVQTGNSYCDASSCILYEGDTVTGFNGDEISIKDLNPSSISFYVNNVPTAEIIAYGGTSLPQYFSSGSVLTITSLDSEKVEFTYSLSEDVSDELGYLHMCVGTPTNARCGSTGPDYTHANFDSAHSPGILFNGVRFFMRWGVETYTDPVLGPSKRTTIVVTDNNRNVLKQELLGLQHEGLYGGINFRPTYMQDAYYDCPAPYNIPANDCATVRVRVGSCNDGIKNGGETGVDCGGECDECLPTCDEMAGAICASGDCLGTTVDSYETELPLETRVCCVTADKCLVPIAPGDVTRSLCTDSGGVNCVNLDNSDCVGNNLDSSIDVGAGEKCCRISTGGCTDNTFRAECRNEYKPSCGQPCQEPHQNVASGWNRCGFLWLKHQRNCRLDYTTEEVRDTPEELIELCEIEGDTYIDKIPN